MERQLGTVDQNSMGVQVAGQQEDEAELAETGALDLEQQLGTELAETHRLLQDSTKDPDARKSWFAKSESCACKT